MEALAKMTRAAAGVMKETRCRTEEIITEIVIIMAVVETSAETEAAREASEEIALAREIESVPTPAIGTRDPEVTSTIVASRTMGEEAIIAAAVCTTTMEVVIEALAEEKTHPETREDTPVAEAIIKPTNSFIS